ncbi:YceI family protein [Pseudohongiella sp.]|uniref:Lipid/polyisoprenoid-binding YceI-like domain-containing protein n=1 Tax=marine sediment metagenome TaxID=412755 RepID=A0A0F9WJG1_9ZZZZ|nr:YceI family protein [Pseudohongiella sp.]
MLSKMFCKYRQVLLVLASSAALVSCDRLITPDFETSVAELRGGQYTLDKEHATLLWKIDHLGFSRYIGRFDDFDATLDFDAENVENSSLEVIIDTASLDVNNEAFAEDLRGDDWFDVANHPQAVFRTTAFVEAVDEDTFVFDGDLTLLGNTGPVTMTVNFNGGGRNFLTRRYTLGFSATAEFLRSDFGLDNMVSFGVGDEIQIEVHVEFQDSSL